MATQKLTEALTADEHFEQADLRTLLKPEAGA
jgi:predicted nucleic acid-binding protein